MELTKNNWWKYYIIGFVLTFAIDIGIHFIFNDINPKISFALAGRLEIIWGFGFLMYCSYKFDF